MTKRTAKPKDSQLVELAGRSWLIGQLLQAGLEVARPERDRGVDLIAYLDLDKTVGDFIACPIQIKAASKTTFGVDLKYKRIPRLLIAYIWDVDNSAKTAAYALTYDEAFKIARRKKWTNTSSWKEGGKAGRRGYTVTTVREDNELWDMLHVYRMTPKSWKEKVIAVCTRDRQNPARRSRDSLLGVGVSPRNQSECKPQPRSGVFRPPRQ